MQIVFRKVLSSESSLIASGEIHLRPGDGLQQPRRDLAALVLEQGVEALRQSSEPAEVIVSDADPTLDDMLAASMVLRLLSSRPIPEGLKAFARYSGMVRAGLRPSKVPLEVSLEGIFLVMRHEAGKDLTDRETSERFLRAWARLADAIFSAAEAGQDPFVASPLASDPDFARERSFLLHDQEVYRQDVRRGEKWLVRIPSERREESITLRGTSSTRWLGGWTLKARLPFASGLLLRQPKSLLYKYWSRNDDQAPVDRVFHFLAIDWGEGSWVFSTDPVYRFPLKGLAESLQQAEKAANPEQAGKDPWFDGKAFAHTLVAAPRAGTRLSAREVQGLVMNWLCARPLSAKKPLLSRRRLLTLAGLAAALILAVGLCAWFFRSQPSQGKRGFEADDDLVEVGESSPGKLYLLSVGVSAYQDPALRLKFADADARALNKAWSEQAGGLFEKVHAKQLLNQEAGRKDILRELAWLKKKANQHDLVIVTISGHGENLEDNDDFFFMPHDYNRKEKEASGVFWDDFKRFLGKMPCRVFLVMDTCHSGTITRRLRSDDDRKAALERQMAKKNLPDAERGLFVLAACLGRGYAQERPEWGHGAMTLAMLEAITGRRLYQDQAETPLPRGRGSKKIINLKDLDYYVTNRVTELVGGHQAVVSNHTGNMALDRIGIAALKD